MGFALGVRTLRDYYLVDRVHFPQNFQRLLAMKLLTVSEKVRELQKWSDHHHATACTVHGSDFARRRQLPKSSIFF